MTIFTLTEDKNELRTAHYLLSPHRDKRPEHMPIDMIVIHGISLPPGEFGGGFVQPFFQGQLNPNLHPYFMTIASLKVSAHLFIERKGSVTQFVPFTERAWHAGDSVFQGRTRCNDFSIGIELEGTDDQPYDPRQYNTLFHLIPLLITAFPAITLERIVGHSEIAPGRKTDPGSYFDWAYLRQALLHRLLEGTLP